ncbi:MAG: hypothetical protein KKA42_05405 [candidate division Zixibacteria bacterium]|nr:hypothetical protein [candidate division Zixibacteria bacterium]
MNIAGFFADIANSLRDRYLDLARDMQANRTPSHFTGTKTDAAAQLPVAAEPVDTYEPSNDPKPSTSEKADTGATDKPANTEAQDTEATDAPATTKPVDQNPDGTYYRRSSRMKYKLDLEFNLAAMTQTVERLAEGDVSAVSEFAAAGFGFNVGFDIKGQQSILTNDADPAEYSKTRDVTMARARNVSKFAAQSRNLAVQSFYKEATDVRRTLSETVRDGHRRTTNKFALRFRMDNKFSMGFADRFNVQTQQVAENAPNAVGQYVESAGQVAEKGSSELMATFFDAVDSYLGDTEQAVLDKVTSFFDQAAAELGFTGDQVAMARDQLTGTIERFFDRVQTAVAGMESKFVSQPQATPEISRSFDPVLDAPATSQDSYDLAVA